MEQKLHTPEGVRDIYSNECRAKLAVQDKLHQVLHLYGYQDIQTPTFEYFDVFRKEIGTISSRELYKFFDREGDTLALRPDITPSIARAAATLFETEDFPIRLCYVGSTFINHSSYQGRLKESTQLGAELIGIDSVEADAEMIAMVVDGLKKVGLKEFQVNIGHVDFLQSLMEATGLSKEQQEEMAKRAEQLLMDYPSLIMKFTLLIQAGMTARKVFQKMSADYMRNRSKTGRYAYEAITIMCHEMDSGVAELEAYRRFGERCGQMKYKTFSTILIQNLQKGSHRMADLLEKEALEAWDERKRKARVLGETAATKLLVPMVMMLAVVMAIIMIPAFLSFYG